MKRVFLKTAILFLAAILFAAACSNEETLPVFIESEVTDSGIDAEMQSKVSTDENGLKTTTLSYDSWLRIKGKTRGNYDDKVIVNLKNTLIDSESETLYQKDTAIIWGNLDLDVYSTRKSYKERSTRKQGYVTIIDSVLVYTVDYKGFVINYELDYEVGEYDDGITRQTLPYYRIENLVDKGSTSSKLENTDDGRYIYSKKLIEHTISVECNGKSYDVVARVTVGKIIGSLDGPYVKKSEIEHIYDPFTVDNYCVISNVYIKKYWSDKTETSEQTYVQLTPFDYAPNFTEFTIRDYDSNPLVLLSYEKIKGRSEIVNNVEKPELYSDYVYHTWRLHYNHFDLDFEILMAEAYYDDGYTCFKFPSIEITDFTCDLPLVSTVSQEYDDSMHPYTYMRLGQTIHAKCGDIPITSTAVVGILAY